MEEKILCPWCGAEMEARAHKNRSNAIGWTKCQNIDCGADGPIVTGKTAVECANKARAAALRRYTPPIKPMTLEEIDALYTADVDHVWPNDRVPPYLYLESALDERDRLWISWAVAVDFLQEGYRRYTRESYGKLWRLWESKPTGEERSAAEWET